jgi:outer membrane protein assembly factor BamE
MKKIGRLIILSFLSLLLVNCSMLRPHKMEIEQGNVITQANVAKLHTGMSKAQVKAVMGTPMLVNVFTPSRVEYVYTLQKGYEPRYQQTVVCIFEHGVLQQVITS